MSKFKLDKEFWAVLKIVKIAQRYTWSFTIGSGEFSDGPSIKYVHKTFRKTNISNPLIRTRTCAHQGVKNVSFSKNYAYVFNEWPLKEY